MTAAEAHEALLTYEEVMQKAASALRAAQLHEFGTKRRLSITFRAQHFGGRINELYPPKNGRVAETGPRNAANCCGFANKLSQILRQLDIDLLPARLTGLAASVGHRSFWLAPMQSVLPRPFGQEPAQHVLEHRRERVVEKRCDALQVRIDL